MAKKYIWEAIEEAVDSQVEVEVRKIFKEAAYNAGYELNAAGIKEPELTKELKRIMMDVANKLGMK